MPIILTDRDTPRLRYVADLLFNRFAGLDAVVTTDPARWSRSPMPRISYTRLPPETAAEAYHIQPSGLLSEEGVAVFPVPEGSREGRPILFPSDAGDHPYDVFSAAFHLVTRYEEYLPHAKDAYGRYDHRQSTAFRLGFLKRPIVEEWAVDLLSSVYSRAGLPAPPVRPFAFATSCDVDIAYAHLHKGPLRSLAAAMRSLASGRLDLLARQARVGMGIERDPYDSYDWMDEVHRTADVSCRYFILLSSRYRGYDRNLDPSSSAMRGLVRRLSGLHEVGLHPSWDSGDHTDRMGEEKRLLESMCGRPITASRQHYLRFSLPGTYRRLLSHGVISDHSMGYGTVNGYRASVSFPHTWYDLESESPTGLTIHPFCFMDATAHHEEGLNPEQALAELRGCLAHARSTGGTLSTVWHNNMLGTDSLYGGWRDVYARFLSEVRSSQKEAGGDSAA